VDAGDVLHPHPGNVRTDLGDLAGLATSIAEHGVLEPLLVERAPGGFQVIAGHRRRAAALRLGLVAVPCVVRPPTGRSRAEEVMLVENLQRADLPPLDEARAIRRLMQLTGAGVDHAARRLGKSGQWVRDRLALLDLPADAQQLVANGQLGTSAATGLARQVRRARAGEVHVGERCPSHLTTRHPLAVAARGVCDQAGHPSRGRVGSVACGACWETAIRADATGRTWDQIPTTSTYRREATR
jgi:ParB family chromosome partitioning protein